MSNGFGKTRVLSVGITDYLPNSGFPKLNKCANNALQIRLALQETAQLNADSEFTNHLTTETTATSPSRGMIISKMMDLAAGSSTDDQILFYFSGHAHHISGIDDIFLVPQDAFTDSDPTALLSLNQVTDILQSSQAKQIIIVLDLCFSGPILSGRQTTSDPDKLLGRFIKQTKGITFLSSSESILQSYELSPHPQLTLFTAELIQALRGEPTALEQNILTTHSFFKYLSTQIEQKAKELDLPQAPILHHTNNETLLLGDFTAFLIPTHSVNFEGQPVKSLILKDSKRESTSSILTNWKDRRLTIEQLEYAANRALTEYLQEELDSLRSGLRKELNFSASELDNEGKQLIFPGGSLTYTFKGQTKDLGLLIRELSLTPDWFDKPDQLKRLIETFELSSEAFVWELGLILEPLKQIASLEAKGWHPLSESISMTKFEKEGVIMTIEPERITFEGLNILSMLEADGQNSSAAECVGDTLQLLPTS
ncbi:caspase family protein [Rubellicoccus peritrichatus]|uniref:Caspase family protein n=1 Tax=Rubellicoccus peritrichatus TaxID=3080537 RepID=A0AAQ3QVM3_9BACT|nr:caspase family protein [Puniceicoccus sp. CR14]WOO41055.1 caspase family protein [Puniceicoccus sp. CR14]